jgi:hypothetical protein
LADGAAGDPVAGVAGDGFEEHPHCDDATASPKTHDLVIDPTQFLLIAILL